MIITTYMYVGTYLDDVDARDLLRDGVLHLHAGVHLQGFAVVLFLVGG